MTELSEVDRLILQAMFPSKRPGTRTRSLCEAMRRGLIPNWALPEALEIMRSLDERRSFAPKTSIPTRGWKDDPGPGWDNVIRALEEDR